MYYTPEILEHAGFTSKAVFCLKMTLRRLSEMCAVVFAVCFAVVICFSLVWLSYYDLKRGSYVAECKQPYWRRCCDVCTVFTGAEPDVDHVHGDEQDSHSRRHG